MSLLPSLNASSVEGGVYDYYFALKNEKAQNWSKYPATQDVQIGNHGITGVSFLDIDGQVLTADETTLLLNGEPIATIPGITGIEMWADYPAIKDIHMNAEGLTGEPFGITGSKYYGFYQGSTLGITGTVGSSTLLLDGQAIGGTGYTGSAKYWSQNPAISSINGGGNNLSNVLGIHSNTLMADTSITAPSATFTNATITNLNVSGITGITGIASNWSNFPAISDVTLAGHNINSGSQYPITINCDRDFTLNSNSGIVTVNTGTTGIFKQDFNVNSGRTNITADLGASLGFDSSIILTGQNGNRGNIILDAKAGNAGLGGVVNITAEGGEVDGYSYGGLITLDATTPTLTGLSSAIKLSASGIDSYAGATPIGSVLGYNFVYGRLGVNLTASVTLPATNIPGTVYLYGDNGCVIGSSLYVYNQITNYYNGASNPQPLNITGRTVAFVDYPVNLDIVGSITFTSQQSGQINGCKQFSGNNTGMTGISSISTGTINSSGTATLHDISTGTITTTGTATLHDISTNTIIAKTANSLTLSGVSSISGNAIIINSGTGTITIEGTETDITSTNTYITNASIETLTATTINGITASTVIAPCKSLSGTFGVVALTTAPIVVYQSSNLTWNWNTLAGLGSGISVTVGVDTVGTYAFACQILYNSATYAFNTFTLSSPCVANSGSYNGVNVVTATFNDSFNNVIPNSSTYKVLIYMWCGSISSANTTGGKVAVNLISGQSL